MMFFKKFFAKNLKYYLDKGDKYLEEERYADARHSFLEALEKVNDCEDAVAAELQVRERLAVTGNKLALLNISEAAHALNRGDTVKAGEHIQLAHELATDLGIVERVMQLEGQISQVPRQPQQAASHHCGGCKGSEDTVAAEDLQRDHLMADNRFEFLLNTLPESLAKRYAAMGEKFATAYLEANEGDERLALRLYRELLQNGPNDILLYEIAILHFRNADMGECEKLLREAIHINPGNELCYLGLVQLLVDSGRASESVPPLQHMIAEHMMAGQATIMLADVYLLLGEEAAAMELLMPALKSAATAKASAERLVPLLEGQNRREEAAYLFKTHLKGCC